MAKTAQTELPEVPVVTGTSVKIGSRGRLSLAPAILAAAGLKDGDLANVFVYEGVIYVKKQ